MSGNPLGEVDPYGLFKVTSYELPSGPSVGQHRYKFRFTQGCKIQWLLDMLNPKGKAGWFSKQQKKFKNKYSSGENDVGSENLCACRNVDSKLQEIYRSKGYTIGESLSRESAESLLSDFQSYLENRDKEECPDCEVAYNSYPWPKLLDLADQRSLPPSRYYLNGLL